MFTSSSERKNRTDHGAACRADYHIQYNLGYGVRTHTDPTLHVQENTGSSKTNFVIKKFSFLFSPLPSDLKINRLIARMA